MKVLRWVVYGILFSVVLFVIAMRIGASEEPLAK